MKFKKPRFSKPKLLKNKFIPTCLPTTAINNSSV